MWLKAKTPIKISDGKTVTESDPPFELDDDAGAEMLELGAADQVDAPATEPPSKTKK